MAEGNDSTRKSPQSEVELEIVEEPRRSEMSGKEVYNTVTDLVGGVNVRRNDNVWQAKVIGVCLVLGVLIGAAFSHKIDDEAPRYLGMILGGFGSLVLGFFGSGLYLMIYRAKQHFRGDHK